MNYMKSIKKRNSINSVLYLFGLPSLIRTFERVYTLHGKLKQESMWRSG